MTIFFSMLLTIKFRFPYLWIILFSTFPGHIGSTLSSLDEFLTTTDRNLLSALCSSSDSILLAEILLLKLVVGARTPNANCHSRTGSHRWHHSWHSHIIHCHQVGVVPHLLLHAHIVNTVGFNPDIIFGLMSIFCSIFGSIPSNFGSIVA